VLRLTVEIWPGGDSQRARAVAIANIANVSDLADVSDYAVSVTEGHNSIADTRPWSQHGHILQHDRRTSVWALVAKVAIWAAEEAAKNKR
jgi:hypothetical protein